MGNKCFKTQKRTLANNKSGYESIKTNKNPEEEFKRKMSIKKSKLEKSKQLEENDNSLDFELKNGSDTNHNLDNKIQEIKLETEKLPISTNNLANLYLQNNISFFNINNERVLQAYTIIKKLGNGAFGKCYLAHLKKGNKTSNFAIKSIPLDEIDKAKLLLLKTEINCLKTLVHPNIVHFYQLYYDNDDIHMVMEPCMNGSLFDKIVQKGSFSEKETLRIMVALLTALNYCHKNKVIHRDIKPENILLVNSPSTMNDEPEYDFDLRIIDFGLSHIYSKKDVSSILNSSVGSPYFMAPEVLNQHYNSKCDIWSLGVLFYFLIAGIPPFYSDSIPELFKKIISSKPSFEGNKWRVISTDTKLVISKMLKKEFKERPSCEEVLKSKCFIEELTRLHNPQKLYSHEEFIKVLVLYFNNKNLFIKQVTSVVMSQLSSNDFREATIVFKILDTYNNGFAPCENLITHLKERKFNDTSFHKVSHLCYSDLVEAASYRKLHDEDFCKMAFAIFDHNNDGKITLNDFSCTLFKNVSKITQNEIDEILLSVELKHDFELSYESFKGLLKA